MTPAQRTMVAYRRSLAKRRERLFDDWLAQWPVAREALSAYDRQMERIAKRRGVRPKRERFCKVRGCTDTGKVVPRV